MSIGLFDEKFYSDTNPIEKGWIFNRWHNEEWTFDLSLGFAGHSRNWSCGSLNIDVFSFAIEIGPFEFFIAYRFRVFPPIGTIHATAEEGRDK